MEEDRVERAIQFLLDNQAAHDVRLARLEQVVEQLVVSQDKLSEDLYEGLRQMNDGIERLTQVCEATTQQVQNILELEIRNSTRIKRLENISLSLDDRLENLEKKNEETE